jgi:IS30 family transposase
VGTFDEQPWGFSISGINSTAELADLFGVARSTVYRAVERERTRNAMGVGTTVG